MASSSSTENSEFVDVKRRQALHLNEPELREFERKLRNAFLSKEQLCQIEEKRYEELRQSVEKRRESQIQSETSKWKDEMENKKRQQILQDKIKYGQLLECQIELKKTNKVKEESVVVEEKERFIRLQNQYRQEQNRQIKQKQEQTAQHKLEMDLLIKSKEAEKQKLKALSLNEEKKAEEYRQYQQQRNEQLMKDFKAKMKGKEEICEKIGLNIFKQQKLSEERRELIKELREYEDAIKREKKPQDDNKIGFKRELIRVLKAQIELHNQKEAILKEDEVLYTKQIMERVKDEERLEIENRYISKLKSQKYSMDILKQIRSNEERNVQEQTFVENTNQYIRKYNEAMRRQIEEEKLKMIQHNEHINSLHDKHVKKTTQK